MNVLLLSNQYPNKDNVGNPIMYRMRNALQQDKRIQKVEFVPVRYSVKAMVALRKKAREYDVVHVHFGGLYALGLWFVFWGIPAIKIITFHGTDIHAKALKTAKGWKRKLKIRLNQKASFLSILLFDKCGFVAKEMMSYVPMSLGTQMHKKAFIQPLGVDYSIFKTMDKSKAQEILGLEPGHYVLFSDISNTTIKRRDIAEKIVEGMGKSYQLLIMSGVQPKEVPYYINACDFALLTSDEEGSPNIIREVLALNKPFFSVEVGDAAKQLAGLKNSAIISRDVSVAIQTIKEKLDCEYTDNTREERKNILDFVKINERIVDLYLKEKQ